MLLKPSGLALLLHLAAIAAATPIERSATTSDVALVERNLDDRATDIELLSIQDKCSIISAASGVVIAAGQVPGIVNWISGLIKKASDDHSCAIISGNIGGVNYQYQASGRNCDTTSEQKTVNAAVQKAIKYMNGHAYQACFKFTHGGTWTGKLQIAAQNRPIIAGICDNAPYSITI
ncbi:hypothetical protein G7Y79_00062g093520 [Physcia stellaris]|nr:hypothetical protein G7Y79_00062g093520 [Physcia stellaris]